MLHSPDVQIAVHPQAKKRLMLLLRQMYGIIDALHDPQNANALRRLVCDCRNVIDGRYTPDEQEIIDAIAAELLSEIEF